MKLLRIGIALTVAMFLSNLTHAANFDFKQSSGGFHDSLQFTSDGITVTVTAPNATNKVSQVEKGLGNGFSLFNHLIDIGEELTFTFSETVTIESIVSGAQFSSGLFNLIYEGGTITDIASPINGFTTTALGATTTQFTVSGTDRYALVSGLNGVYAAVPAPATAWLFGSALVALAGLRRRK